jgi:transposase
MAARCLKASRAAKRSAQRVIEGQVPPELAALAPQEARLSDEQWGRAKPILSPQRGGIGRPPNDHQAVLSGILWVARTGSSWREMPEEYGDFTTAYKRQKLWEGQGLWRQIFEGLGEETLPRPATKDHKWYCRDYLCLSAL